MKPLPLNGKLSRVENYNNDELKVVKSFDEKGNLVSNDVVQNEVAVESVYPGGQLGWSSFLKNNVKYPKDAVKKEIQGEVVVQFLVDEKG